MNWKEQYQKETGNNYIRLIEDLEEVFDEKYVKWLENKLTKLTEHCKDLEYYIYG